MTERIDAFLARLDHLSVDDLEVLAIEAAPLEAHDRLLDAADAAAITAGRLDEVDEAADRANDAVVRALSRRGYDPTWLGLNWGRTLGRTEDRVELIRAVEDAAIAAVVADVAPETAAALAEPFERLVAMGGSAWATNPTAHRDPRLVRLLWAAAAVGLVGATIGWLMELAAEYAPSYLFFE